MIRGGASSSRREAQAVLAHPGVPPPINEARIADFLDDLEGVDLTSTFFEEIYRLPPAHALTVGAEGVSIRRYWELQAPPPLDLPSDEAYAEAFLEVFTEAVRCRLRSAGPVGAMLSGGMDSGSVRRWRRDCWRVTGEDRCTTFSGVGPEPKACVETRTIQMTAALPGLAPHFIDHSELAADRQALIDLPVSGEPFDFHMTLIRAVDQAAHRQGVKILLDGVAGDVALTTDSPVGMMLRRGNVLAAFREARAEARFWGPTWPKWRSFIHGAWAAWAPGLVRDCKEKVRAKLADRRLARMGLTSPEFATAIDLPAWRRRCRGQAIDDRPFGVERRRQAILHPHLTAARERFDRVASAMAIEPRDPFMDVRLIHFCLSLPAAQLQAHGWPKIILRRAMRGILPDRVIWRRGKEHLGLAFTLSLFDGWAGWSGDLAAARPLLERFVRPAVLDESNQRRGKALDIGQRFKLFFLLSWLGRSASYPPAAAPMMGNENVEEDA